MEDKLQKLTEKIYSEGVTKANEEATKIVNSAKSEAEGIVAAAKKEAEKIIAESQQKSEELRKNVSSELAMSAKQSMAAIRQDISALITAKTATKSVSAAFDDVAFVKEMLATTVKNWNASAELKVVIPKKDAAGLESFITAGIEGAVNKGVTIEHDAEIRAGFKITPTDNSFLISFTDKDFEAFMKNYIRPRTNELLYGGK